MFCVTRTGYNFQIFPPVIVLYEAKYYAGDKSADDVFVEIILRGGGVATISTCKSFHQNIILFRRRATFNDLLDN